MKIKHHLWRVFALTLSTMAMERRTVWGGALLATLCALAGLLYFTLS